MQRKVDTNVLANAHRHVLPHGNGEAWRLYANAVSARHQAGRRVLSRVVRGKRSRNSARHIGDGHHRARHHTTALIGHSPIDATQIELTDRGQTAQQQPETHSECPEYVTLLSEPEQFHIASNKLGCSDTYAVTY